MHVTFLGCGPSKLAQLSRSAAGRRRRGPADRPVSRRAERILLCRRRAHDARGSAHPWLGSGLERYGRGVRGRPGGVVAAHGGHLLQVPDHVADDCSARTAGLYDTLEERLTHIARDMTTACILRHRTMHSRGRHIEDQFSPEFGTEAGRREPRPDVPAARGRGGAMPPPYAAEKVARRATNRRRTSSVYRCVGAH